MKNSIRAILGILVCILTPFSVVAETDTVSLADLKAQTPTSVQFKIDNVTYDVPIILPKGDVLPITYATQIPLDPSSVRYTVQAGSRIDKQPSVRFSINAAPNGKSKRYPDGRIEWLLMEGDTPENNLISPSRPLEKANELLNILGANVELRVLYQRATSRPYYAMEVSDGDEMYPYRTHFEANLTAPIIGYDQGFYRTRFAQYIQGVQVLGSLYYPEAFDQSCLYEIGDLSIGMNLLSEEDFTFSCGGLLQATETIQSDAKMKGFNYVVDAVQNRIDSGKLQNVFAIELCYQVMLKPVSDNNDNTAISVVQVPREDEIASPFFARLVLVPVWKVVGYDTKDANTYMEGYGVHPSTRMSCESDEVFHLRINALTGQPVTSMIYH